jgi:hypothetical protein
MPQMNQTFASLIARLDDPAVGKTRVIPWSSPVPSFGDWSTALVGTVGLNPSSREFQDETGVELEGERRRLQTLRSLGISRWSEAGPTHLDRVIESCRTYFAGNPYNTWFRSLDAVIAGTTASFYGGSVRAAHLDLIPFATACKWIKLRTLERRQLLKLAGDTLGLLLRESPIRLLVLNGMAVVSTLEGLARERFVRHRTTAWCLPRSAGMPVPGFAFSGTIQEIGGVKFGRTVRVLGFNHNLQSSFGVTAHARSAIRDWIGAVGREAIA